MLATISRLSLALMAASLIALLALHALLSPAPAVIVVQCAAFALMLWARFTFGRRSFHASADPTAGGIVTSGPYHFIRHPIYTAACLFGWAGVIAHWSALTAALGILLFLGALGRMICEERLIAPAYPGYRDYARATKRMIPGVF